MSHECFAYAKMLDREEVCDAGTRLLLLVVAEHTRNKTGRCYEDRAQLAHDCRCSTKTIQRKLKEMAGASPPIVKLYPRYRSDGSRRSDEIEIVGFRAWLKRNDPSTPEPDPSDPEGEAPDGADEAPGNEPSEEGSGPLENPPSADTPPGQSVQAPPWTICPYPWTPAVHTPGQQVSTYKERPSFTRKRYTHNYGRE